MTDVLLEVRHSVDGRRVELLYAGTYLVARYPLETFTELGTPRPPEKFYFGGRSEAERFFADCLAGLRVVQEAPAKKISARIQLYSEPSKTRECYGVRIIDALDAHHVAGVSRHTHEAATAVFVELVRRAEEEPETFGLSSGVLVLGGRTGPRHGDHWGDA